ncbi:glycosyltransferase family 2 protein [Crocinitomix catalasitica]|uniref:glycosyltransferase family 2 protein n=1 Tax=Crocinitomix catalasitica TaxID=184607 RepID=UPI0005613F9A|nr:glycosyltransferase family 2 protein [Crocinitomix catalasitica]
MTKNELLSLVVPVYYEEECVLEFIAQTTAVLHEMDVRYEIVFIDDGSTDQTVNLIKGKIIENPNIKLIEFSYNHGKQAAVSAGIRYAKGDYLIYMDPDLQDPPHEIPRFVEEIEKGYDLVFGVRKEKKDSFINKLYSKVFWGTLEKFTGLNLPRGLAVMRIFNRKFADIFNQYPESNRFIEGIFMHIGLKQTNIEVEQQERFAGKTKFNFKKKMQLAVNAIIDYSNLPLKITMRVGIFITLLGLLSLLSIFIVKFFFIDFQTGWASLASIMIFGFGLQTFFLGIVARYIGSIYKEVKRRPHYSIKEFNNFEE